MSQKKVAQLTPSEANPRKITDTQLELLRRSMQEFGDLSGVVENRATGHLVGGHQRVKHLDPGASIHMTEEYDEPDAQGTVGIGYVVQPDGTRWNYRLVSWAPETEAAANIAANRHGGTWDFGLLTDILSELDASGMDATLTGFDQAELEEMLAGWAGSEADDPGAYDADQDVFTVKIGGVRPIDKDEVVEKLQATIRDMNLDYEVKAI